MSVVFYALVGAASAAPHAEVEAALVQFSEAVAAGDTDAVRRLLHPDSVQVVMLPDAQMVLSVDAYVGAMQAGQVGGHPIELSVSGIAVSGRVATASTTRKTGPMLLTDAVTLAWSESGWQIVSMAVQAVPGD